MRIGIACSPTFGGSGVVATELGQQLSRQGHEVHFISYQRPERLMYLNVRLYLIKLGKSLINDRFFHKPALGG